MTPQRDQIELRALDLESLLPPGHAARTVWALVQLVDLGAAICAHQVGRAWPKPRRSLTATEWRMR
jgi:hypothetical protein